MIIMSIIFVGIRQPVTVECYQLHFIQANELEVELAICINCNFNYPLFALK